MQIKGKSMVSLHTPELQKITDGTPKKAIAAAFLALGKMFASLFANINIGKYEKTAK